MEMRKTAPRTERSRFPDGFRILQGKQEYVTYVEHSSIRVWPSEVSGHYDNHMHSAVEIILPYRGVAVYHLPEKEYRVEPGEVLIVPSGCPHALTESEGMGRYLLLFEPNPLYALQDIPGINPMTQTPVYLRDQSELQDRVSQLLMQVVDCYFRKEPMWNTECYSYLLQMYAVLGREYLRVNAVQEPAGHRSIDPEIMNSAITFINEHYMDDISLEAVARFTGFSKYYFSRSFKDFFGVSFSSYLTVKRVNAAASLLTRSNQSIREIAMAAGFGSVATFNRIFREQKNCTPSQYRAIYGSGVNVRREKPIF